MKRLQFMGGVAGALAMPSLLRAQRPATLPTLGILHELPEATPQQIAASPFTRWLSELGWVEGKTFLVERRTSAGQFERLPALADDLVTRGVDVIWTIGPRATFVATRATKIIPIVFVRAIATAETGCSQTLARPSGNCTGVASSASKEVYAKPFEFLRDISRDAKRVTAIGGRVSLLNTLSPQLIDNVMRRTGIEVTLRPVASLDDLDKAFAEMAENRAHAVYVHSTQMVFEHRQRVVDLALRQRLPSLHDESIYVDAGGLLSYGSDILATMKQSLTQVDKILRGAKVVDIPIEQPTRFDLVINMKTARALDIKIPSVVLLRADRVIE